MTRLPHGLTAPGRNFALACLGLLAALPVQAQLMVRLSMEHVSFVSREGVKARVSIHNAVDEAFIIDDYDEYVKNNVRFRIWQTGEQPLAPVNQKRLVSEWMVLPGERTGKTVVLDSCYPVTEPGRYFARAEVVWGDHVYTSGQVMFDVVSGITAAKITRTVPGHRDVSRTYRLLYWSRSQREYLFLRIDDGEGKDKVFMGLYALGPVVRFHKPILTVTPAGVVREMHQVARSRFLQNEWQTARGGLTYLGQEQIGDGAISPLIEALQEEQERSEGGATEPEKKK